MRGGLGSGSQHGSSFKRKSVRLKKRDKDDGDQGDGELLIYLLDYSRMFE